jgi:hypothetical protein
MRVTGISTIIYICICIYIYIYVCVYLYMYMHMQMHMYMYMYMHMYMYIYMYIYIYVCLYIYTSNIHVNRVSISYNKWYTYTHHTLQIKKKTSWYTPILSQWYPYETMFVAIWGLSNGPGHLWWPWNQDAGRWGRWRGRWGAENVLSYLSTCNNDW